MAHRYKGRTVPDCFINPKGEMLAMWEDGHSQCMKCSVEALCQEAQFELDAGMIPDDYGFKDDVEIVRASPVKNITANQTSSSSARQVAGVAATAIAPRGPRMNELQLAVPRSRQVLPYAGETLFERLGKNVLLGGVTSTAFETMLTFGAFEWKPEPPKEQAPPPPDEEGKKALNEIREYLKERKERDEQQRKDIEALRQIIEGKK